ncbi:MAG: LamG domain-containing protein, partial [Ignavibacterium sp.]
LVDHALEKTASFIIFTRTINATKYYYAIYGSGADQAGKIAYGGPDNIGGVSGTDSSAVIQASVNSLINGTIILKDVSLPSSVTLKENVIVEERLGKAISFYQLNQPTFSIPDTLEDGLVLYMPFENTGNRAIDLSQYNNEGFINGATLTTGKIGQALSFDGVDDYVRVVDNESLRLTGNLTISLWIYLNSMPTIKYCLVEKYWDGEFAFFVYPNGCVNFAHGSPNEELTVLPAGSVTAGQWIHLTVTRNMSTMKLTGYKNGQAGTPVTFVRTPTATGYWVYIGIETGNNFPFNGLIDEIRIYNRALTIEEIKQLYFSSALKYGTIDLVKAKLRKNRGMAIFSGDGKTTTFNIPHGLVSTPNYVSLEALSTDAVGDKYWSADANNINIVFITAPPTGTNNIVICWKGEV